MGISGAFSEIFQKNAPSNKPNIHIFFRRWILDTFYALLSLKLNVLYKNFEKEEKEFSR